MSDTLFLHRYAYTGWATYGQFFLPEFECWTIERPWAQNRPRQSCIPEGRYKMVHGRYNRGGYPCLELMAVPGRSLIKIHRANVASELMGCIGPGMGTGVVNGEMGVTNSTEALDELMRMVADYSVEMIEIRHSPTLFAPSYPEKEVA